MTTGISPVRGVVLEESASATIYEGFPHNVYEETRTEFSVEEEKFLDALAGGLNRGLRTEDWVGKLPSGLGKGFANAYKARIISYAESAELIDKLPTPEDWDRITKLLLELLVEYDAPVKNADAFVQRVLDEGIGYGYLGTVMRDPDLEEVMVNGTMRNVFVYHRKHGMCKTTIFIPLHDTHLPRIIGKAAKFAGRQFHEKDPLLDARLPDGSRLNATFETVATFGHTLTIRKFSNNSLSLVELISNGTLSSETAAFLWLMCEGMNVHPLNMIITGGSGTGKTTLLNALASVVRYRERIVTIEDTTELQFKSRDNWISLESRTGTPGVPAVSMNDLLKNAMRMRPDRIILGEVRGEEAETLFVAMDTGHQGCLGTLHSNSAREMLVRLTTEPMNVPQSLVHLLELVVVLQKVYDYKEGMKRRILHIAEVSHIDQNVLLSNMYERRPDTDTLLRTDTPSHTLQLLSDVSGKPKQRITQELNVREKILEWMLKHGIKDSNSVEEIIQQYYFDPASVLDQVNQEL